MKIKLDKSSYNLVMVGKILPGSVIVHEEECFIVCTSSRWTSDVECVSLEDGSRLLLDPQKDITVYDGTVSLKPVTHVGPYLKHTIKRKIYVAAKFAREAWLYADERGFSALDTGLIIDPNQLKGLQDITLHVLPTAETLPLFYEILREAQRQRLKIEFV